MSNDSPGNTLPVRDRSITLDDDEMPRLVVVEGASSGTVLILARSEARVGRTPTNDLVLNSPSVSKSHAVVRSQGGVFCIADLDSTNGVIINGIKVGAASPHELRHGDSIRIGDHVVLFWHRVPHEGTRGPSNIEIDREKAAADAEKLIRGLARADDPGDERMDTDVSSGRR